MPAARFYDVIRNFRLNRAGLTGPGVSPQIVATPGDTIRRDGENFTLLCSDGSEVRVDTSPSHYGPYVQTRIE